MIKSKKHALKIQNARHEKGLLGISKAVRRYFMRVSKEKDPDKWIGLYLKEIDKLPSFWLGCVRK